MYLSHFKLREKPFQLNTDPRFLWLGRQHQDALAALEYGIRENKGLLLLTGEIGTGKTALISAFADRLADDNLVIANLPDPGLVRNDFFFLVSHSFGIHHRVQDKETFTEVFDNFLERICKRGQKALLIVDEAQIMSTEILEEVRLLSNMECRSTRLLNIILVGQNGFNRLLNRPENRAIRGRISISYNLQPLTEAETEAYIAHRLKIAGAETKIFTHGAVREIQAFSSGSPRQINIICDLAMVLGFGKNKTKIDRRAITTCKERMRIPNKSESPRTDEDLPARVNSPSKTILVSDSLPAGDHSTPHPPEREALPIPAEPHRQSSRIGFHIVLVLLIFMPSSYLLYSELNLGQPPEKPSAPETIPASAGQPARKATASFAPLAQPPPSLSSGVVKIPPSVKVSEKSTAKEIPADSVVVLRPTPEAIQTQKKALPQGAEPPLTDEKPEIAAPEKSVSPIAAEKPPEKPIHPTTSPTAPALVPATLQTEQMVDVNRTASQRKPASLKKDPQTLPIPSPETPDPADIVNWLLQQKRHKGAKRPHP